MDEKLGIIMKEPAAPVTGCGGTTVPGRGCETDLSANNFDSFGSWTWRLNHARRQEKRAPAGTNFQTRTFRDEGKQRSVKGHLELGQE